MPRFAERGEAEGPHTARGQTQVASPVFPPPCAAPLEVGLAQEARADSDLSPPSLQTDGPRRPRKPGSETV